MTQRPGRIEVHEAAHAIGCVLYALPFRCVRLTPGNPEQAGSVEFGANAPDVGSRGALVMTSMGPMAELRLTGRAPREWDDRDDDPATDWAHWRDGIRTLARRERRPPGDVCEELIGRAQHLVRVHWDAILRVAAALGERQILFPAEVRELWRGPQCRSA